MTFTVLSIANGQINETQNANDLERAVELASGKVSSICWVSFFHFMALLDDEKNTFFSYCFRFLYIIFI